VPCFSHWVRDMEFGKTGLPERVDLLLRR